MSDGATQPEGRAQGHPDENQREVGAIQGEPGAEAIRVMPLSPRLERKFMQMVPQRSRLQR
jgi:hypothetical protein